MSYRHFVRGRLATSKLFIDCYSSANCTSHRTFHSSTFCLNTMSQGILYGTNETRSILPVGLIKVFGLDIEIKPKATAEHAASFPLKRAPSFIDPTGYKIHEAIAVIFYFVRLHDKNSPLIGNNDKEKASILQYLSFATGDFMVAVSLVIGGLLGRVPYNEEVVEANKKTIDYYIKLLEDDLKDKEYLVGDRLTVADLFVATTFYRPITLWLGKEWREGHPIFVKWFSKVIKSEFIGWFFDDLKWADEPVGPPKK
ncbi:DEKNAAE103127 [Brettanomyces naardenensis]|uniref:DEKNAAE103127 n=1 Tax=Brettanomyces naardenensis TaxID=13370 RepID=A0A448YMH3_BRENA|nr:DEKNAAE103127 [Brettanomyces naardenensis]